MRCLRVGLLCAVVGVAGGTAMAGQSGKTGAVLITGAKGQKKNQDPFNIKVPDGKSTWQKTKGKILGKHWKKGKKPKGNEDGLWHILPHW